MARAYSLTGTQQTAKGLTTAVFLSHIFVAYIVIVSL